MVGNGAKVVRRKRLRDWSLLLGLGLTRNGGSLCCVRGVFFYISYFGERLEISS